MRLNSIEPWQYVLSQTCEVTPIERQPYFAAIHSSQNTGRSPGVQIASQVLLEDILAKVLYFSKSILGFGIKITAGLLK
jgi:hypothetical protein